MSGNVDILSSVYDHAENAFVPEEHQQLQSRDVAASASVSSDRHLEREPGTSIHSDASSFILSPGHRGSTSPERARRSIHLERQQSWSGSTSGNSSDSTKGDCKLTCSRIRVHNLANAAE